MTSTALQLPPNRRMAMRKGQDIDELVLELRALCATTGLELAIRVGQLVLQRLYDGDVKRWSRRRARDTSLRRLEQRPDLPFRASTLSKSVAIYQLSRRRPELTRDRRASRNDARRLCQQAESLERQLANHLLSLAHRGSERTLFERSGCEHA